MASAWQLAKLKEGVEGWNEWRDQNCKEPIDLIKADLQGINLCGANLELADLYKADLQGANLIGTDLSYACLKKADLDGADLSTAYLHGADISAAYLRNTNLSHADLSDTNLRRTRLTNVDFSSVDLRRAILCGAYLSSANLSSATLDGVNLHGAHLTDVNLCNIKLESIDLGLSDLSGAHLEGAHFNSSDLSGADLNGAFLQRADLSSVNLSGASLIGTHIDGADLCGANLCEANVSGIIFNPKMMIDKYRGIRVDSCYGDALFKRNAQDQDYIDSKRRECHGGWSKIKFAIWAYTDYGRSIYNVVVFAIFCMFWFGVLYCIPNAVTPNIGATDNLTPYYFSIVTFTTLGYGEIHAASSLGKFFVITEVILGYFTLGLLLSVLANKVARRS